MLQILFATSNRDKEKILAHLFEDMLGENTFVSRSLRDFPGTVEPEEAWSIVERAEIKCRSYHEQIRDFHGYIVGSDDGIEVNSFGWVNPDSHTITDAILSWVYPIATTIIIHRAIALLETDSGKMYKCVTELPFLFVGNPENIIRTKWVFPLSWVLTPLWSDLLYGDLSEQENRTDIFRHSEKQMWNMKHFIEDSISRKNIFP